MIDHLQLQLDREVLSRIDARVAREHEEKLYRPTAVGIIEHPRGTVLVVKSAKSRGHWGAPQGGIESGESAIMGLFNELKEEVSFDPSVASDCRFCYATRLPVPNGRDGFMIGKSYYFFHVKCHTPPEVSLQVEEVSEYRWLPPYEVGNFLYCQGASHQKMRVMLTALQRAWRRT